MFYDCWLFGEKIPVFSDERGFEEPTRPMRTGLGSKFSCPVATNSLMLNSASPVEINALRLLVGR